MIFSFTFNYNGQGVALVDSKSAMMTREGEAILKAIMIDGAMERLQELRDECGCMVRPMNPPKPAKNSTPAPSPGTKGATDD